MVESGLQRFAAARHCAPIAHDIYEEILKKENAASAKNLGAETK